MDTGASAGKGIVYLHGSSPSGETQIALSYLLADELGKDVGDTVEIISGRQTYKMEICNIYQDVTSGGKTAKTIYDFPGEASEKYTYQLELSKGGSAGPRDAEMKNWLKKRDFERFTERIHIWGAAGQMPCPFPRR